MEIIIHDKDNHELARSASGSMAHLDYHAHYREGDSITVLAAEAGSFAKIQLDDTLPPTLVYLKDGSYRFEVPCGEKRLAYSPKSFSGALHLISACDAHEEEAYARRNLALNPYDWAGLTGAYPHAGANIETRGESCFAARNVIDGVYANHFHGEWPFQSWGINQRLDAELRIDLGAHAEVDELRVTIRCDFPHDSHWVQATALFSDGSSEILTLEKTPLPQVLRFSARNTDSVVLKDLIQADDPSPFPALTELEIWGRYQKA